MRLTLHSSVLCSALVGLLGLLTIPACSHTGSDAGDGEVAPGGDAGKPAPTPSPEAEPSPQPEVAPEPEEPEAESQVQDMTLTASELTPVDGAPGIVEHCLDCARQSATYTYCHFDKAALEAKVGADKLGESVTLSVKMTPKASKTDVPADPNAPQPDGGFKRNYHTCVAQ